MEEPFRSIRFGRLFFFKGLIFRWIWTVEIAFTGHAERR